MEDQPMNYFGGIKLNGEGVYLVVLNFGYIQSSLWEAKESESSTPARFFQSVVQEACAFQYNQQGP